MRPLLLSLCILMMLLVLVLQKLGEVTATCTQGAVGPFLTGVTLSGPLLAAVSVYLAVLWRVTLRPSEQYGCAIVAALSFMVVVVNFEVWKRTLVMAGSACGPDYNYTDEAWEWDQLAIGLVYGVWPFLLAIAATLRVLRTYNDRR